MTGIYDTPKVIHILETDKDGNKMTVRYIREDIINNFVNDVRGKLDVMLKEMDNPSF